MSGPNEPFREQVLNIQSEKHPSAAAFLNRWVVTQKWVIELF